MITRTYKAVTPTIVFNGSFMDHEQTALQAALQVLVPSIPQCPRCHQLQILVSAEGFTPFRRVFDFDFRCSCGILFVLRNLPLPLLNERPTVSITGFDRLAAAPAARSYSYC